MKVKAAVVEQPGRIVIREFERPQIGPEEGLLKVEMAGICSTDVKIWHGAYPCSYPIIMGHEILGHIEAIGDKAARSYGVKEGDRVVVEASIPCGYCYYCRIGSYRFCEAALGYGTKTPCTVPPYLWGAYAQEMYLAPRTGLHKISSKIPAETAVLITTVISNGIQWAQRLGGVQVGDTVAIVGAGPQALGCVAASREGGASRIIVLGLTVDSQRLELAREMGAHHTINVEATDPVSRVSELTRGRMADVVVEVSGSPQGITTAIQLVRKQGTVVLAGLTGTHTLTSLPMDKVVLGEIRLQGAFSKGLEAIRAAIDLAETGKYPFHKMVTHKLPLEKAEEALRWVAREVEGVNPIKVALTPSS